MQLTVELTIEDFICVYCYSAMDISAAIYELIDSALEMSNLTALTAFVRGVRMLAKTASFALWAKPAVWIFGILRGFCFRLLFGLNWWRSYGRILCGLGLLNVNRLLSGRYRAAL